MASGCSIYILIRVIMKVPLQTIYPHEARLWPTIYLTSRSCKNGSNEAIYIFTHVRGLVQTLSCNKEPSMLSIQSVYIYLLVQQCDAPSTFFHHQQYTFLRFWTPSLYIKHLPLQLLACIAHTLIAAKLTVGSPLELQTT